MSNPLFYRLSLIMIPQVGPVTAKNLIGHFGAAEKVFEASISELKGILGKNELVINSRSRRGGEIYLRS